MKQNLTELVFIIDRSGSMAGLEVDTIRHAAKAEKGRGRSTGDNCVVQS